MKHKHTAKKQPTQADWHKADIKAALEKAGWTLRGLSRHHGYAHSTQLVCVLHRHWPKGERLVAEAIGVKPEEIWPSRYLDKPRKRRQKRTNRDAA